MNGDSGQPWLRSAAFDGTLIVGPALLATAIAWMLTGVGRADADVSLWGWVLLVVGIDVAHVYVTLYRTYLDPIERRALAGWLIGIPVLAWVGGVLLYSWSAAVFWSVLAYTAVFHFVRQQYGFLMLYSRAERDFPAWCRWLDRVAIYGATLFPLLYWHTHLPRPFSWFVDGDFLALPRILWTVIGPLYPLLLASWLAKEVWIAARSGRFNIPRCALVTGTALSWYVGIVAAAGDLVFTLTNVVAHGIPYIALTWLFASNRDQRLGRQKSFFVLRWVPGVIGLLLLLALLEEGLWDSLVWREHGTLFPWLQWLPHLEEHEALALVVPLLAVPQLTHYLLDGVIWRLGAHPNWRGTLFWRRSASP
jgi:hypothetical protein